MRLCQGPEPNANGCHWIIDGREDGMPAGLSKMQAMAWRKSHAGKAGAKSDAQPGQAKQGSASAAASQARLARQARQGNKADDDKMPAGLSKMQQMAWRKQHKSKKKKKQK